MEGFELGRVGASLEGNLGERIDLGMVQARKGRNCLMANLIEAVGVIQGR
jgi:hypothetical protein